MTDQEPRAVESAYSVARWIYGLGDDGISQDVRPRLEEWEAAIREQVIDEIIETLKALADEKIAMSRNVSEKCAATEPMFWKSDGIRDGIERIRAMKSTKGGGR